MYSYLMDDRMDRYIRRYQLAMRLLAHGARSRTITKWCGLTRDQLITLRKRWSMAQDDRQRGPAPTSLQVFFRSQCQREQAAIFASLCWMLFDRTRLSHGGDPTRDSFVSVENGELLCEALEAFREWQPEATMEFEYALLLARAVLREHTLVLNECPACDKAILNESGGGSGAGCEHFRHRRSARQEFEQRVIGNEENEKTQPHRHHGQERKLRPSGRDFNRDRRNAAQHNKSAADPVHNRRENSEN